VPVGWHTTIAERPGRHVVKRSHREKSATVLGQCQYRRDLVATAAQESVRGIHSIFRHFWRLGLHIDDKSRRCFRAAQTQHAGAKRVQAMFSRRCRADRELVPAAAPGFWMTIGTALFAAMPGVRRKMYAMFAQSILPRLLQQGLSGGGPAAQDQLLAARVNLRSRRSCSI